jgi:DNA-binding NtrC family response regulator
MIGRSSFFQEVIRQGKLAALTSSNVLITGESGKGKELMPRLFIMPATDSISLP